MGRVMVRSAVILVAVMTVASCGSVHKSKRSKKPAAATPGRLVTAPHLIGSRIAHARARLTGLRLTMNLTTTRTGHKMLNGRIFRQRPGPGTRVYRGTTVHVWAHVFGRSGSRFRGPAPRPRLKPLVRPAARPGTKASLGAKKYPRLTKRVESLAGQVGAVRLIKDPGQRGAAVTSLKRQVFDLRLQVIGRLRQDPKSVGLRAMLRKLFALDNDLDKTGR